MRRVLSLDLSVDIARKTFAQVTSGYPQGFNSDDCDSFALNVLQMVSNSPKQDWLRAAGFFGPYLIVVQISAWLDALHSESQQLSCLKAVSDS